MASPAEPVLASDLWSLHCTQNGDAAQPKRKKLPFHFTPVDSILDGGLEYGYIHSITSQPEHGAQELIQALLVSHLSHTPDAVATIIDSTLSFDVRKLHAALSDSLDSSPDNSTQAMEALNRLQIMQVFDFVGMTESVSELREALECRYRPTSSPPTIPGGTTIADSQAEEDDGILTPAPSIPPSNPNPTASASSPPPPPPSSLLIIDDISQLTLPLLKNNWPQGQSLLTTSFRSLAHLTRSNSLCTVVVGAASARPRRQTDGDAGRLSQFAACALRPATGDGLGYLVDTHIYLHPVPAMHGRAMGTGSYGRGKGTTVEVLEVVQDRIGARAGRWVGFGWDEGGKLLRGE